MAFIFTLHKVNLHNFYFIYLLHLQSFDIILWVINMNDWEKAIEIFDFAFQPIIDSNTGRLYGVEALLRNYKEAGFESINKVFDRAYSDNYLYTLDLKLREKVITKYSKIFFCNDIKLFYNLDNRVLEMPNFSMGNTELMLAKHGIKKSVMTFEISEKHRFNNIVNINNMLSIYKEQGYNIAIDDFGSGFSNLQKLFHIEVDILKIDSFFISDIEKSSKKRLFVNNIINLVHSIGGIVVAEGVETKEEFSVCKKIGCDLIQGYYVGYPTKDILEIKEEYSFVNEFIKDSKEYISEDRKIIEEHLINFPSLYIDKDLEVVLKILKANTKMEFIPILDIQDRPIGVIKENDIKNYLLSPCGQELLKRKTIKDLVEKTLVSDINISVEKLIELFSFQENLDEIILTEFGKYRGVLNKSSIIRIISEKKIVEARNQNPLTKLAGNIMISDYIQNTLEAIDESYAYVYFDFNNFKSFNDKYGFKKGDEIIFLFSEILKENSLKSSSFIGHIGGDDFFLGIRYLKNDNFDVIYEKVKKIGKEFRESVKTYYSLEDIENGFVSSTDRNGIVKNIPLLSVAIVVLEVPKGRMKYVIEDISNLMFKLKKEAKTHLDFIVGATLMLS